MDSLAKPDRGALLIYPVVQPTTDAVIIAFTQFTPRTAQPLNGQVVQFRAKDTGAPKKAIVDTGNN